MQLSKDHEKAKGTFNNDSMQNLIERLKINKEDLDSHHSLVSRIAAIKNEIAMTWEMYSKSYAWLFNFDISKDEKQHVELVWIATEKAQ